MKINRLKLKKRLPEPSANCKLFINKLISCDRNELHHLLRPITIWHIGSWQMYHWVDVLDLFDSILEEACIKTGTWMLNCDKTENVELKILVPDILHFSALLIEHSYSRHLYNSIEYLIILLQSSDIHIILGVLSLLYVFSKRSNFITRLQIDKKQALIDRVICLAETWGGRENEFDLARCCSVQNPSDFPEHATNLHFTYTTSIDSTMVISKQIDIPNVHLAGSTASAIMEMILTEHILPDDKKLKLFTHLRFVYAFPSFDQRLLYIQARLQALSILVYSGDIQKATNVLYDGLIKELVEVLNVHDSILTDIKATVLKTLTAIVHLEHRINNSQRLQEIIEATEIDSYNGFLPTLVRQCTDKLMDDNKEQFPRSLSTALFSFLYHLASYEIGCDALLNWDIVQLLIKIVNYHDESQDSIMFAARAVRIMDVITMLDIKSFQTHNGLQAFINRLEYEITQCKKEQPFIIHVSKRNEETPSVQSDISDINELIPSSPISGLSYYHQRIALIKSILKYLKRTFTETAINDTTMYGSLPNSLKHIISNVEYYGQALFNLATDLINPFIFQESSSLDNDLTDVLMDALLKKDVPVVK